MKTAFRLAVALLVVACVVCTKDTSASHTASNTGKAGVTSEKTAGNSQVDRRIRFEMQALGLSRDAAVNHLIRIGIARAAPDPKDPLGLLENDQQFIEAGIQRYMKQKSVSRADAVQQLLRIAAATDPANPLGLDRN